MLIAALFHTGLQAQTPWQPYIVADTFARSEPMTIQVALDGWEGDFSNGNTQYLNTWLEAGVRYGDWGLGIFHRRDYGLRFSDDMAELYGSVANDLDLEVGREYDLWLESYGLVARGLRGFKRIEWQQKIAVEIGLSLLEASYLMDGTLDGEATATGDNSYDYSAWVDYSYTKDVLFERDVASTTGYGASLDLSLEYQISDDWLWLLQARDVLGAVWWQDAPYTQAEAYSDRVEVSDSGYAEWDPLISGVEDYQDYTQRLKTRITSELYYNHHGITYGIGARYWFSDTLTRLGAGYSFGDLDLFAWYWLEDQGLEFVASWSQYTLSFGADSLEWGEMDSISLNLAYNY